MITTLDQVVERVKGKPIKRLAVAVAEDPHTIEAVGRAVREKLVRAVLTGDEKAIRKVASDAKVDPGLLEVIHEPDKAKALALAIGLVREGKADFLMKGLLDSSLYIRGIIDKEKGLLPPGKLLSHVSVIQAPAWKKLIVCGDVAVIPAPDLEAKAAILNYAIAVAHKLEIEKPKAALLSAVEKVNPKMPSTTESAIIAKMAERGQIKGAIVDGPLALDVAFSEESARIKGIVSPVAGDADILVFPGIEAGNIFFKAATYLARAELAAVVVGARCPCVLTSRGDSEDTKFYSIALASLLS
ncbi:MAG TPA: bifunctional enoyl-CoA hydratase/phosphate acetyltransferase [Candidatus Aminicenantes bacterium]|nr:bifunctional enoyl-CoA hydratase/phosphate acetyltransferase [Candidatus Aminicenantes bacterium]